MTPRVWAPDAERMSVRFDGADHAMVRSADGWWSADLDLPHGSDYAFVIGDAALPDPRSRWQPNGVHEPSRVYDHDRFAWSDAAWEGRALEGSVVYEMHIGTFTAQRTFDAAIERLDHLVDLGIDLVEVLPVNAFDGPHGWGYDGVLWGAVHEPYGGPDGFKRFVDACHTRGLGVVLDVVYNHLGPSGAYLDRFAPYFAGQNDWGPGLNLDGPHSDPVRRYVLDNAVDWFEHFHVDGLRLDAVHALVDTRALTLLEELSQETADRAERLGRPLTLIAESDRNDPRTVTPRAANGLGLDAQWCDDVHHALHARLTGESHGYYADFAAPDALETTLRRAFFHAGTWSSFRERTHGRPVDVSTTPGSAFVVYLQDHDQIGNRAAGDRITATVSTDLAGCGAALVLLGPFTPMLFMGEEWGAATPWQFFASFPDPELADAVRTGRRREFGAHGWAEADVPDPMDPATVERSTLDWSEADRGDHRDLLDLHRSLIALRRAHPALREPSLDPADGHRVEESDGRLMMRRGDVGVVVDLVTESFEVRDAGGGVLLAWGAGVRPS